MTLRTPGNKPHLDKNNISSSWQRANISKVGLKPSVQPQRVAGLDLQGRSVCCSGIQ